MLSLVLLLATIGFELAGVVTLSRYGAHRRNTDRSSPRSRAERTRTATVFEPLSPVMGDVIHAPRD